MKKATCEKLLPQGGTDDVGESSSALALSPSYSGGGNSRYLGLTQNDDVGSMVVAASANACDSDTSVGTIMSAQSDENGRFWRNGPKRPRRGNSPVSSGAESQSSAILKSSSGVAEIRRKRELFLKRKNEKSAEAQNLVEGQIQKAQEHWVVLGQVASASEEVDSGTVTALSERIHGDLDIVFNVATKSGNLKGTFVRALKESVASIKMATEILCKRSSTEETERLQRDNARLNSEMAELRREMVELRKEVAASRAPKASESQPFQKATEQPPSQGRPPQKKKEVPISLPVVDAANIGVEELTRSIMMQVGSMVSARLEVLEGRLPPEKRIRPPLAADRNKDSLPTVAPEPKRSEPIPTTERQKQPPRAEEEWTTVGRRQGAKKKGGPKPATPNGTDTTSSKKKREAAAASSTKRKSGVGKMRPPRSSAVVIKLQPEAEEKGITYANVLKEAREKFALADCGIAGGVRLRETATGARIMEVPGATSGAQADALAQKLRESIGGVADISRPTKCAEMRVTGMCDSVSPAEIVAAVAQQGGCPIESVKVGVPRRDSWGNSSVWVSCPVASVKKIGTAGRLLVGWVSAHVTLLKPRPMRCYRCLYGGHVRAKCTNEVDRSDECYRCGRTGHKATDCKADAPRCSLCAAAKKPADHVLGSKKCSPPKPKKRAQPAAESSPPSQPTGEEGMNVG